MILRNRCTKLLFFVKRNVCCCFLGWQFIYLTLTIWSLMFVEEREFAPAIRQVLSIIKNFHPVGSRMIWVENYGTSHAVVTLLDNEPLMADLCMLLGKYTMKSLHSLTTLSPLLPIAINCISWEQIMFILVRQQGISWMEIEIVADFRFLCYICTGHDSWCSFFRKIWAQIV